jgi:DNA-binding XRE family transcriptional regulator
MKRSKKKHYEHPDVTRRLIALRKMHTENQAEFSRWLDTSPTVWNNIEQGFPLSRGLMLKLTFQFDWLSLDWLFFGEARAMPKAIQRRLDEIAGSA